MPALTLEPARVPEVAQLLSVALHDDPAYAHIFPDAGKRRAQLQRFFHRYVGAHVAFGCTFAGTQVLRLQLQQGAPADLFASADRRHVKALRDARLLTAPTPFARGQLVIIVPAAGASPVTDLPSLPTDRVETIPIPEDLAVAAHYHIATTTHASAPTLAREFTALLRSDRGRTILTRHGFTPQP